jgi:hypothetical protein
MLGSGVVVDKGKATGTCAGAHAARSMMAIRSIVGMRIFIDELYWVRVRRDYT